MSEALPSFLQVIRILMDPPSWTDTKQAPKEPQYLFVAYRLDLQSHVEEGMHVFPTNMKNEQRVHVS